MGDGGGIVGDFTISISRFAYRYLWRFDQDDDIGLSRNALAYAWSMAFERFALCCNDKYVALSGSNAFFFPNKPQAFHDLCADYARFSALSQLAVFALSGFDARSLLFLQSRRPFGRCRRSRQRPSSCRTMVWMIKVEASAAHQKTG